MTFGGMTLLQQDDPRDPMRMAIRQVVCVFAQLDALTVKRLRDGRRAKAGGGRQGQRLLPVWAAPVTARATGSRRPCPRPAPCSNGATPSMRSAPTSTTDLTTTRVTASAGPARRSGPSFARAGLRAVPMWAVN